MSVKASTWAWSLTLCAQHKIVLLALADSANDDGACWPGLETISTKTGVKRRSLISILKKLEEQGFLTKERRWKDGHQSSNLYRLNMGATDAPLNMSAILAPMSEGMSAESAPMDGVMGAPDAPMVGGMGANSASMSAKLVHPNHKIEPSVVTTEETQPTFSASGDAAQVAEEPYYLTKKKRKLTGRRLAYFNAFWEAFAWRTGKAEAADAFYDLPKMLPAEYDRLIAAAAEEARRRPAVIASGRTPKYGQGWLSGRRWEDYDYTEPDAYSDEQQALIDAFNTSCGRMPQVTEFMPRRAAAISVLLAAYPKIKWHRAFAAIAQMDLPPHVGFDWIIRPENFVSLKERSHARG